jgi:hypothetical protein
MSSSDSAFGGEDDFEWEEPASVTASASASASAVAAAVAAPIVLADLPPLRVQVLLPDSAFPPEGTVWVGNHDGFTRIGPFPLTTDMRTLVYGNKETGAPAFPLHDDAFRKTVKRPNAFASWDGLNGRSWIITDMRYSAVSKMKKLTDEEVERGEKQTESDDYILYNALVIWFAAQKLTPQWY